MDGILKSKPEMAIIDDWDRLFRPPNLRLGNISSQQHQTVPDDQLPEREVKVPLEIRRKSVSESSVEFQMTIRAKERIKPKSLAILLTVQAVEAVEEGCYLQTYLSLVYLLEANRSLLRNPNVNRDATKKAIALGETVLLAYGNREWFGFFEREGLPEWAMEKISSIPWYPDARTLGSWKEYYQPGRFLELRIVPLEQFQEHPVNTLPYSSYTKGYHESGRGYSRDGMVYGEGKTPFDPEIDEDRESKPVDLSSPIDEDPVYRTLVTAIQKAKERNRKK